MRQIKEVKSTKALAENIHHELFINDPHEHNRKRKKKGKQLLATWCMGKRVSRAFAGNVAEPSWKKSVFHRAWSSRWRLFSKAFFIESLNLTRLRKHFNDVSILSLVKNWEWLELKISEKLLLSMKLLGNLRGRTLRWDLNFGLFRPSFHFKAFSRSFCSDGN